VQMINTIENAHNIASNIPIITNGAVVFRAIIRPAEDVGGFWAACDMEHGGCTVQGDTVQETQTLMQEAVAFYLEDHPHIMNYYLNFEFRNA